MYDARVASHTNGGAHKQHYIPRLSFFQELFANQKDKKKSAAPSLQILKKIVQYKGMKP
jgi:hypothetical protein